MDEKLEPMSEADFLREILHNFSEEILHRREYEQTASRFFQDKLKKDSFVLDMEQYLGNPVTVYTDDRWQFHQGKLTSVHKKWIKLELAMETRMIPLRDIYMITLLEKT